MAIFYFPKVLNSSGIYPYIFLFLSLGGVYYITFWCSCWSCSCGVQVQLPCYRVWLANTNSTFPTLVSYSIRWVYQWDSDLDIFEFTITRSYFFLAPFKKRWIELQDPNSFYSIRTLDSDKVKMISNKKGFFFRQKD